MFDALSATRRRFLGRAAQSAGVALVIPSLVSCASEEADKSSEKSSSSVAPVTDPLVVPNKRPAGWNPIEFNLKRGLAGAIPTSYHASITGPDAAKLHIGKHILYNSPLDKTLVPSGFIALMAGDFTRGYAKHPAAATHWYDSISIVKEGTSQVIKSTFAAWPVGNYLVLGGGPIEDATGSNTIYLAALPPGVNLGDTIRVAGHCNIHGEYVDFITL